MANSVLWNKIRRVADRIDSLAPLGFSGRVFAWQEYPFVTDDNRLTLAEALRVGRKKFHQILFVGCTSWRNPEQHPPSRIERFFTASNNIRERSEEFAPEIDCDLNSNRGVILFRPPGVPPLDCNGSDDLKVMPRSYDFSGNALPQAEELVKSLREIGEVIAMLPNAWSELFDDDLPHSKELEPVTTAVMAAVGLANRGILPRRHANKWATWKYMTSPEGNEIVCSIVLTSFSNQDDASSCDFGRLQAELSDVWGAMLSLVDFLGEFLRDTKAEAKDEIGATPHNSKPSEQAASASTAGIFDAILNLQSSLAGIEQRDRGPNFEWQTVQDAVRVVRARLAATEDLDADINPAEQRKLVGLLDELSARYHLESGEPIIGPPDEQIVRSVREAIRAFAPDSEGVAAMPETPVQTKSKRGSTVNDRMKAEMASNLEEVKGWTAKQWANHLGCGQTTVKDTETWKSLTQIRQQTKAEKATDRHHRK